jgi:hypothetical protein
MKKKEDFEAYRKRDSRVKCALCNRFMRYTPTEKTPARRRSPPNAATCTECPILKTTADGGVQLIHEEQLYN